MMLDTPNLRPLVEGFEKYLDEYPMETYQSPWHKESLYYYADREVHAEVKDWLRTIVFRWAYDQDITVNVRMDLDFHTGRKCFWLTEIQIWNSIGSINSRGWLNKVSIECRDWSTARIRTHKARTDPKFLSPLDENFKELVITLNEIMLNHRRAS